LRFHGSFAAGLAGCLVWREFGSGVISPGKLSARGSFFKI
jgi:hypothetical protein